MSSIHIKTQYGFALVVTILLGALVHIASMTRAPEVDAPPTVYSPVHRQTEAVGDFNSSMIARYTSEVASPYAASERVPFFSRVSDILQYIADRIMNGVRKITVVFW